MPPSLNDSPRTFYQKWALSEIKKRSGSFRNKIPKAEELSTTTLRMKKKLGNVLTTQTDPTYQQMEFNEELSEQEYGLREFDPITDERGLLMTKNDNTLRGVDFLAAMAVDKKELVPSDRFGREFIINNGGASSTMPLETLRLYYPELIDVIEIDGKILGTFIALQLDPRAPTPQEKNTFGGLSAQEFLESLRVGPVPSTGLNRQDALNLLEDQKLTSLAYVTVNDFYTHQYFAALLRAFMSYKLINKGYEVGMFDIFKVDRLVTAAGVDPYGERKYQTFHPYEEPIINWRNYNSIKKTSKYVGSSFSYLPVSEMIPMFEHQEKAFYDMEAILKGDKAELENIFVEIEWLNFTIPLRPSLYVQSQKIIENGLYKKIMPLASNQEFVDFLSSIRESMSLR